MGLNNLNMNSAVNFANTADIADASYIDIPANSVLLKEVKKHINIPIAVSSISLAELYNCAVEGVDIIEIGNYNYLYKYNIRLLPQHIVNIAKEAKSIFQNLDVCVTIPYYLSLEQQVNLSIQLESEGIQLIQLESKQNMKVARDVTTIIDDILPFLSSTYIVSRAISRPVMVSLAVDSFMASLVLMQGASGVGIDVSAKRHKNSLMRSINIKEIITSVQKNKLISTFNVITVKQKNNDLVLHA